MQTRTLLSFGHGSNPGRVREHNEDYHRVKQYQMTRGMLHFLAVADGMGGAAAGEFASKIVIDFITKALGDYVEFVNQGKAAIGLDKVLERSIIAANREVYKTARENPEREGMGSTLTAMVIDGDKAVLGHVGDSRAYLVRAGKIKQISKDHSWVADQVEKGILTLEQAENHQYRNMLIRVIGTKPEVAPDIQTVQLLRDDIIILSSDGMHGLVNEKEILEELNRTSALQSAIEFWIGLANTRGGPDNITCVVAKVGR